MYSKNHKAFILTKIIIIFLRKNISDKALQHISTRQNLIASKTSSPTFHGMVGFLKQVQKLQILFLLNMYPCFMAATKIH